MLCAAQRARAAPALDDRILAGMVAGAHDTAGCGLRAVDDRAFARAAGDAVHLAVEALGTVDGERLAHVGTGRAVFRTRGSSARITSDGRRVRTRRWRPRQRAAGRIGRRVLPGIQRRSSRSGLTSSDRSSCPSTGEPRTPADDQASRSATHADGASRARLVDVRRDHVDCAGRNLHHQADDAEPREIPVSSHRHQVGTPRPPERLRRRSSPFPTRGKGRGWGWGGRAAPGNRVTSCKILRSWLNFQAVAYMGMVAYIPRRDPGDPRNGISLAALSAAVGSHAPARAGAGGGGGAVGWRAR